MENNQNGLIQLDISQLAKLSENNDHENIVCKIEKCVSKNSSPSHPVTPIMKTTESRSAIRIASFSGHENIMGGNPKSAVKKNLDTKFKNKLDNCLKMKLMGNCEELIRESEIGIRRAGDGEGDKYQVS